MVVSMLPPVSMRAVTEPWTKKDWLRSDLLKHSCLLNFLCVRSFADFIKNSSVIDDRIRKSLRKIITSYEGINRKILKDLFHSIPQGSSCDELGDLRSENSIHRGLSLFFGTDYFTCRWSNQPYLCQPFLFRNNKMANREWLLNSGTVLIFQSKS